MAFVTSQIVIIGIGLLPINEWRSPLSKKTKRHATSSAPAGGTAISGTPAGAS